MARMLGMAWTRFVNYYGKKYGLPEAYSDNASFLYWMPEQMRITNLVLLTDDEHEMEHKFVKDFSSAVLVDSVTNPFARERGDLIIVLKGANENFNQMFREKLAKKKAEQETLEANEFTLAKLVERYQAEYVAQRNKPSGAAKWDTSSAGSMHLVIAPLIASLRTMC